jgi:hypothetical protein
MCGDTLCNLSIREVEVGGSKVQGQPGPHSETLSQNNIDNSNKKPRPKTTGNRKKLSIIRGTAKKERSF